MPPLLQGHYLFGSRPLTHIAFWLAYYVFFSLIWAKQESGYFAAFYLEFVLLPPRMMAVYGMLYWLIPRFLITGRYQHFILGYGSLLLCAGMLQRLAGYYFYEQLLLDTQTSLLTPAALFRAVMLINTTVVCVAAVKIFHLYVDARQQSQVNAEHPIEVKASRRTHILNPEQILYLEGLGNYVTYHLDNGEKLVVYTSMKAAKAELPERFLRLHKSFVVNTRHIRSFNSDNVTIGDNTLPRGKDIDDAQLLSGRFHPD